MPSRSRLEPRGRTSGRLVLGVAFFAYLVVVAHGISHLGGPSVDGMASRHCAICSVTEHALAIPVAMPASCVLGNVLVAGFVAPQTPPACSIDSVVLARAPPLRARRPTIG